LALRTGLSLRLLMRIGRVTFRAFPKTEASLFGPNLGKKHEPPIMGATDPGPNFLLDNVSVVCVEEIPARSLEADQTTTLLANIHERFPSLDLRFWKHLPVMLVAKHVKVSRRTGTQSFLFACYVCGEHR